MSIIFKHFSCVPITPTIIRSMLVVILALLVLLYLRKIHRIYRTFTRMGLPGPMPRFFFGNAIELLAHSRHSAACLAEWTKIYGKIYGFYIGHTPVICVSDVDFLQEMFVTKFSHFHSRRSLPLQRHDLRHLLASTGDEWRRQRSIIQPTFSPTKLKEMTPIVEKCLDQLILELDQQKSNVEFDISLLLKRTTMDVILRCAFGMNMSTERNIGEPFFKRCIQVFQFDLFQTSLTTLSLLLPELDFIWVNIFKYTNIIRLWLHDRIPFMNRLIDTDPHTWLLHHVGNVIKQRCLHDIKRVDLLQLMIEATDIAKKTSSLPQSPKLLLNYDELLNNIYLFMLGGYETTATALAYLSYVLATHPNEQARLQHEIDHVYHDYDELMKLDYLDWVVRETLRLFPIAPFIVNRQCNKACTIGQFQIEAGTNFTIDMFSIHFDPILYGPVSPFVFYPERFQQKRHPMAWLPFGVGPRSCVGMRFAMLEIKLALTRILRRYTLLPGENTMSKFAEQERFVIGPKHGIWVRLQRRDSDI